MLKAFEEYLLQQVENRSIYVWGAQGQGARTISEQWIKKRETSGKNAARAIRYWKKQVDAGYGEALMAFDCSGLGVYYFLRQGLIARDMNANALMKLSKPIQKKDLLSGDFVFRINKKTKVAYHIGYIADNKRTVIEAKGRDDGVVKSAADGWDYYARPPFFRNAAGKAKNRILKLHAPYLRGGDVLLLQRTLKNRGYDVGALDGIFGKNTERAVRAFQEAAGLSVDGKAGKDTFAALKLPFVR